MEHLIEKQISHGNFSTQNRAKTENLGRWVRARGVEPRKEVKEGGAEPQEGNLQYQGQDEALQSPGSFSLSLIWPILHLNHFLTRLE